MSPSCSERSRKSFCVSADRSPAHQPLSLRWNDRSDATTHFSDWLSVAKTERNSHDAFHLWPLRISFSVSPW